MDTPKINTNMDIPPSQIKPAYSPDTSTKEESPSIQSILTNLNLQPHPEGGYYKETHRSSQQVPNPFQSTTDKANGEKNKTRAASSSILYLLTPGSPLGAFHRNLARTVHTWHHGRGRYVVIHADEVKDNERQKARIETFLVGPDAGRGERQQWVVEGGKYKASFLLPDSPGEDVNGGEKGQATEGLLISEMVTPGFDFADHDFLRREQMEKLLTPEQVKDLGWMLRERD